MWGVTRFGRRVGVAFAALVAFAILMPAAASAIPVTVTQVSGFYGVNLYDPTGEVNHVAVTTVTPSGGSPDLVIGDTTAGIPDPIPFPFQRVDPTIIRAPLDQFRDFDANLGAGNDTLGFGTTPDLDTAALQLYTAYLGLGNDVAKGGPGMNQFYGGPGRDLMEGGPLNDKLFGGAQNDFSVGLGGRDLFKCGKGGHDLFNDGPGKDLVDVGSCEFRVHSKF